MRFLHRRVKDTEARGPDAVNPPEPEAPEGSEGLAESQTDAVERERELGLLRDEQRRFDELTQRQLRYARYVWQPPSQGGDRRADDPEEAAKDR
jgi:hypothetical protein